MTIGVIGRKLGMTRVFTEDGVSTPVTVIEVESNRVTQIKTADNDGYSAIQVAFGHVKANKVNKPLAGHYAKAEVEAAKGMCEFRITPEQEGNFTLGKALTIDIFSDGQIVDVSGTNIGKGFQGGIKRHNFSSQDMTHGNSLSHRANGSIGQNQTPGRVFKGKKMSGHMGNKRVTIQNLQIVKVDADKNVLLVKGGIPGSKGSDVIIRPAVKANA